LCDVIDQGRTFLEENENVCPYEYAAYIMVKHPDIIPKLMEFVGGRSMTKRQYSSLITKVIASMREYFASAYLVVDWNDIPQDEEKH
jgi:hypothetical protein